MAKKTYELPIIIYLLVDEVIAGRATCDPATASDTCLLVPEGKLRKWVIYILKKKGFDPAGNPISMPDVPEDK